MDQKKRKWFQLVDSNGIAFTSSSSVFVAIEDVDTLREAVHKKYKTSYLERIPGSDLTVFANNAAYKAGKKMPMSSSPVTNLGNEESYALVVQAPVQLGREPLGLIGTPFNPTRLQFSRDPI